MNEGTDNIPFHQRLRLERFKRRWTQVRLSQEVKVDLRTVRRWEKGKAAPQFKQQERLSRVLGMTPEELGLDLHIPPGQTKTVEPSVPAESDQEGEGFGEGFKEEYEQSTAPLWNEVPSLSSFSGRKNELAELRNWIVVDGCKIVSILGMGGIGKTTLAIKLVERIRPAFSAIFWYTLRNAPSLEQVLPQCIQVLSGRVSATSPQQIEGQISDLIHILQQKRCLLILDNIETVMQPGQGPGFFAATYELYGTLIRRIGESKHQSCLVITSREKPNEVALLEGPHAVVRSLPLQGVDVDAGIELMKDKELQGSAQEWEQLVERYSGNPLALKLSAEPIHELFEGSIEFFLNEGGMLFKGIHQLLEQQLSRLPDQEYALLRWLAIEREAVSPERLRENLVRSVSMDVVLDTLNALRRRSMIEKYGDSTFTLQPVIMEYITAELIEQFVEGFVSGLDAPWPTYALMKAQVPEYVRESQERFLLDPVAQRLLERYSKQVLMQKFQQALDRERSVSLQQSNYLAANVLHVLSALDADLRGLDCSELVIWQAYLQEVSLPFTNFARATFIGSTFINMAGNALSVAFSATGKFLAIGTASDEIWLYELKSGTVLFTYRGHTDAVWSVSFSPDGNVLASSSDDGTIRLWDTRTGLNIKVVNGRCGRIKAVAFSPNGKWVASGSNDYMARIWSVKSGRCVQVLSGHTSRIWSVAFSPDGQMLATGSADQTVRLWNLTTGVCLELKGHNSWVLAVAFSPDGKWLASGGDDCKIRLWELATFKEVRVFEGHVARVRSLSFHRDGVRLASGSEDHTVRVWNVGTGEALGVLEGHMHGVRAVAFYPRLNSDILASGGDDQTTRIWDVENGYCLKTLQGYTNRIWAVAFSPDGQTLVSGSEDQKVRIWRMDDEGQPREMQEQGHALRSLAYSRDGKYVATGGEDRTIRVWEVASGLCMKTLSGHESWIRAVAFSLDSQMVASGGEDHAIMLWRVSNGALYKQFIGHGSWIRALAFSPDGRTLASGSDDKTIRIWSLSSGKEQRVFERHTQQVRTIAFSPDGKLLASGGEDNMIYLWNPKNDEVRELVGHEDWVRSIAFSPDGKVLVSGSEDMMVRMWDVESGACLQILRGHTDRVRSVAFNPLGQTFVSSSDDGTIRVWDAQRGDFLKLLRSERPYEGMLISDVQGLTDAQRLNLRALGAIE
jgi:WD40 repeat protein/transcriptional regulator with XRE-family HTH domain